MKQKNLFFILCILSTILYPLSSVLATPILQLQHDQIQPGETILATITTSGEFTEQIEKFQIKFFDGRKQTTLETDIFFYNQTHYFYIYTTQEKNLTLQVENILYKESDTLQSTTITTNLTISTNILTNEETNETYTQILKIKPGFILTTTTPQLQLTNVGTSQINLTYDEQEISINPLTTHELEFTPTQTFTLIKISTYKDFLIPTLHLTSEENTTFISPAIKADLRQSPDLLLAEIFTDTKSQETIQLFNFGDDNLTNLKATSSLDFIKLTDLQDMPGRGVQNLTLEFEPEISGHFQGTINISYTQNETSNILEIPLSIFILPKGTPEENFQIQNETCEELSGQVCEAGYDCKGTEIYSKSKELCCIGSCIEEIDYDNPEDSSGFGWLIAIVIFTILGFIGYYFYKKQKSFQAPTSKDKMSEISNKFEKRLAGQSKRITGGLTKT